MTPERVADLVARWVRLYTRGLPASLAGRRIDEVDADVLDHIQHERDHGTGDRRIALDLGSRMARGLAADLSWRTDHARAATPDRRRHLTGGSAMRFTRTGLLTMSIAGAVIGAVLVLSGLLFAPPRSDPHPLAVVAWLAFGGGVVTVSRLGSRPVVLGAAALVGVVAVTDLLTSLLELGGVAPGLISRSQYTWIGIAILAANGLARDTRSAPSPGR